tara:strand:+ start:954 stop:1664 length:711 start_codon:yes stop_codon:yes gene_type:complete
MRLLKRIFLFIIILSLYGCSLNYKYRAHKENFENQIQKLENLNEYKSMKDYLLFIGSSSIRRWVSLAEDMAPYSSINRGYGGAHYYDLIHYIDRLIENKEQATAIIIFVGNDITGGKGLNNRHNDITPKEVKKLVKVITNKIHNNLSNDLPIFIIETTPTPKRWHVWDKIVQANDLIKDYMERQPNHYFISTRNQFINNYGRPIGKYFVKDSLHLSKAGYNLWSEIIKNELENNLN